MYRMRYIRKDPSAAIHVHVVLQHTATFAISIGIRLPEIPPINTTSSNSEVPADRSIDRLVVIDTCIQDAANPNSNTGLQLGRNLENRAYVIIGGSKLKLVRML